MSKINMMHDMQDDMNDDIRDTVGTVSTVDAVGTVDAVSTVDCVTDTINVNLPRLLKIEPLHQDPENPEFARPEFTKKKYRGSCLIPLDSKEVRCERRNIKKLPGPIDLKFVQVLECSHNKITQIPYYANLRSATVRHNLLKDFPGRLRYLRYLDISFNPLGPKCILPSKEELPALEELYCRSTGIKTLSGYPLLKYLDCSRNKVIDLPTAHEMPLLEFLNCGFNSVKIVPIYPCLVTLWCAGNPYIRIPDHYPKLRALDCHSCKLTKMPMGRSLRYLDCRNNCIRVLESCSKQLIWLNCSNNKLVDLPAEIKGLRYFQARGNKFDKNKEKRFELLLRVKCYEMDPGVVGLWNPTKTAIMRR